MGQVHQVLNMGKSLYFLFRADVYYFVVMKQGKFLVQHFVWFLGATICFYLLQVNHSGSCHALSSIHANGENYLSPQKRIRIPMEEEMLSVISNGETNVNSEISDSISSTPFRASKRARHGTHVSAKFKGVVLQPNGHWGAQIYANHQRIWLGTFKTENEAAMAYDSAIIKLRSSDCHRNFPWTNITIKEPKFQRLYSTEAIINMIRGGTYQLKFAEFVRTCSQSVETEVVVNLEKARSNGGLSCKRMFLKELTPSDVGKLNRLVIPKQFAIKFFPPISENGEGNVLSGKLHDVQLVFYDKSMKLWKFRYCYWNSSQSFVFTRGWNRFVKDNQLKAKDVLMFYSCERKEKVKEGQAFWMIDVYKGRSSGGEVEMANECVHGMQVDLQLRLGQNIVYDGDDKNAEEKGLMGVKPTQYTETKGFKLFGVQII